MPEQDLLRELGAIPVPSLESLGAQEYTKAEGEPVGVDIKGSQAKLADELEKLGAEYVPDEAEGEVSGFKRVVGNLLEGPVSGGFKSFMDWESGSGISMSETLQSRAQAGRYVVERGRSAAPGLYGLESAQDTLARIGTMDAERPETITPDFKWSDPQTVAANIFGTTEELIPYMWESAKAGIKYGVAGATGGGVVGSFIPGVGTVVGANAGFRVGSAVGTIKTAAEIEGGNLYVDLIKDGLDEDVARVTALSAGLIIGLIEYGQIGTLLRRVPPAKAKLRQAAIRTVLRNPSMRSTLARSMKALAGDVTKETLQEVVQEWTSLGGELSAKLFEEAFRDKDFKNKPGLRDFGQAALEMLKVAPSFGLLALPGVGVQTDRERGIVRVSKERHAKNHEAIERAEQVGLPKDVQAPSVSVLSAEEAAELAQQEFEGSQVVENMAGEDSNATPESTQQDLEKEDLPDGITQDDLTEALDKSPNGEVTSESLDGKMKAAIVINGKTYVGVNHAEAFNSAVDDFAKAHPELTVEQVTDLTMDEFINSGNAEGFIGESGDFISREDATRIAEQNRDSKEGVPVEQAPADLEKLGAELEAKPKKSRKATAKERKMLRMGKPTILVMLEDTALRIKLKAEAMAAKYGYKAGAADTGARLRAFFNGKIQSLEKKVSEKRAEVKDVKQALVDYIKESLPVSERGRLIDRVRTAETMTQLAKGFQAIDRVRERYQKRDLIERLKKKLHSISRSRVVAIDLKGRITDLIESLDLRSTSDKIKQRLKSTRDFITRETEAGRDVEMPKRILRALEVLDQKPIEEMSLTELELVFDEALRLEQLGKTKLKSLRALYNIKKQEVVDELRGADKQPIDGPSLEKAMPGERLSTKQRLRNFFGKMVGIAQTMDYIVTPMDVIFDMMDGVADYTGAIYKNFKKRTDANFSRYLKRAGETKDAAWKLAKDLGLSKDNFDRIGVWAADQQESGREKLKNNGLTDAFIDSIKLTENEMKLYEHMRREFDAIRPDFERFMREVLNEPLGEVKNYFSFLTDWDAMSQSEVWNRVTGNEEAKGRLKKTPSLSAAKKRTGAGKQAIKINAMEVFTKHMDNVIYALEVAEDNRMLFEIANTEEFGRMYGDRGRFIMLDWLDMIARKGGVRGDVQLAFLDQLRRNVGAATLGLKLSSALIQPTALLDGAALIGGWAFRGARDVATSHEWRDFLLDNSPELRDRVADDPSFREFSDNPTLAGLQEKGYWVLKALDEVTAASVMAGAYMQYMASIGEDVDFDNTNREAMDYAEHILRRTQASAFFKDLPPAISRGDLGFIKNRSVGRLVTQFQTFVLNRWSLIRHDMVRNGIQARDFKKAGNIAMYLMLANFAEYGIRRITEEAVGAMIGAPPEEDEEWWKKAALTLLGNIPYVSQAVSVVGYGSIPVPSLSILSRLGEGAMQRLRGKRDETKMRGVLDLAGFAGVMWGVPGTVQAHDTASDFYTKHFTEAGALLHRSLDLKHLSGLKSRARLVKEKFDLLKRKDPEKATKYLKDEKTAKLYALNGPLNKATASLSKIRSAKRKVLYDKSMPKKDRVKLMSKLDDAMDEIAASFYEALSSV